MSSFSKKRAAGFAVVALSGLLLATGCGSSTPSASPSGASSQTASTPSQTAKSGHKGAHKGALKARVARVEVDKAAQVLAAASAKSSSSNEATFTLTAYNAKGKPVKGAKVAFFIGPMKPLSNVSPTAWYRSGTAAAKAYIATFSKNTNAAGQATLTLYGQPSDSMEMVAVRIGNLSSFDAKAKRGLGTFDAWWTNPKTGRAPIGDYVEVSPFLTAAHAAQSQKVTVTAMSPSGPISGASIQYIEKTGTSGSMSGSGGMGSAGGMSVVADSKGQATFTVAPGKAGKAPVRIVVTQPGSTKRVAGGMSLELFVRKGRSSSGSTSA